MSVMDQEGQNDSSAEDPRRHHAIVVGIETYDAGDGWNLDGPANDAFRFAEWLVRQGTPAENIHLLVAPMGKPDKDRFRTWNGAPVVWPTRQAVSDVLTRTLPTLTGGRLYLFWSGHGFFSNDAQRRLFYADAHPKYLANLDFDSLLRALRTDAFPGFGTQVLFVDACATIVSAAQNRLMPGDLLPEGQQTAGREQFALFAASEGQVARNVRQDQTGLFSAVLLDSLAEQPGWPPDMRLLRDAIYARFKQLRTADKTLQVPTYMWYRNGQTGEDGMHYRQDGGPPDRPPRIAKAVERRHYVERLAFEVATSHIATISGLPGTGKSILAGHVADVQFGDSKYFWHSFAKGQDISSFVIRLSQFLEYTGAVPRDQIPKYVYSSHEDADDRRRSANKVIEMFRLMLSLLRGKGYLLCLDNADLIEHDELAPTFIDLLERECRGGGISALLISDGAMDLLLTVRPLKIEGFSVDETKLLCELHGLPMSEGLVEKLHRETGGNPRLLTSACLRLQQTSDIGQQIDELPENVIDFSSLGKSVDERLKQEPELIEVMMATSLLMENPEIVDVSVGAVEALVNRTDTVRLLLGLFDRSLVRRHSTRFTTSFTLDQPLRTYYHGLLGSRSKGWHGTAGTYYEQEGQVLAAAYHFMEAGELERAAKLILSNVEVLINQGKAAGVDVFLTRFPAQKVNWKLQIELAEAKGDLRVLDGVYDAALLVYQGALSRARIHRPMDTMMVARLHRKIGKCQERTDALDVALKSYGDGLSLLSDAPISVEAMRLHLGIAVVHYAKHDYPGTIRECADALETAERHDDDEWMRAQADLHNIMGLAYRRQRKHDEAIEHFAASIELFNSAGDLLGTAKALDNRGVAFYEQSDLDKAAEDIGASRELFTKIGSRYDVAGTHTNMGMVFYQQGELAKAASEYTKALDILEPMGVKSKTADCYYNLGEVSLKLAKRSGEAHDNVEAGRYLDDVIRYFAEGIRYFRDLEDTDALRDILGLQTEARALAHEIGDEQIAEYNWPQKLDHVLR